jgi:hypothetical protein
MTCGQDEDRTARRRAAVAGRWAGDGPQATASEPDGRPPAVSGRSRLDEVLRTARRLVRTGGHANRSGRTGDSEEGGGRRAGRFAQRVNHPPACAQRIDRGAVVGLGRHARTGRAARNATDTLRPAQVRRRLPTGRGSHLGERTVDARQPVIADGNTRLRARTADRVEHSPIGARLSQPEHRRGPPATAQRLDHRPPGRCPRPELDITDGLARRRARAIHASEVPAVVGARRRRQKGGPPYRPPQRVDQRCPASGNIRADGDAMGRRDAGYGRQACRISSIGAKSADDLRGPMSTG